MTVSTLAILFLFLAIGVQGGQISKLRRRVERLESSICPGG